MTKYSNGFEKGAPFLPDAACQQHDPEIFFPKTNDPNSYLIQVAKLICQNCVERIACQEWALTNDDKPSGIWGGLTEDERRSLLARNKRLISKLT